MTTAVTNHAWTTAGARSAAYSLIGFGFRFPDRTLLDALADPAQWMDWPDVLRAVDPGISEQLERVRSAIANEMNEVRIALDREPDELQHRHDDLFGHAVRGRCPAYEMEYGRHDIIRQAADLADVAGFYRAFGMELADGANGRPDHVTAEFELMSVLCEKEAHAIAAHDEAHIDISVGAQRAFLKDHLSCWLPAFAHRVQEADETGLYGALAGFAAAFVRGECDRFEIEPGLLTLELRPADPVHDRVVSCGPADCAEPPAGERLVQLSTDFDPPPEH